MLVKEIVSNNIPTISKSKINGSILSIMKEFNVLHLPIVNDKNYIGLISKDDVNDLINEKQPRQLSLVSPFIFEEQHIYEAFLLISKLKLSVLPVLNKKKKYVGAITIPKLMNTFSQSLAIKDPGAVIILEVNEIDYSLAQIAQIVESNKAKILSLNILQLRDSKMMEIVIKVSVIDPSSIILTFQRYDYFVKSLHTEEKNNILKDLYADRFESFMRYINI